MRSRGRRSLLPPWPHRCDTHYHRSSRVWSFMSLPFTVISPLPVMITASLLHAAPTQLNTAPLLLPPPSTAVIPVSERSVTKINKRKESEGIFKQPLFRRDDFPALSLPLLRGGGINSDVWWAIQGQDEQFHFWFMR